MNGDLCHPTAESKGASSEAAAENAVLCYDKIWANIYIILYMDSVYIYISESEAR